MGVNVVEREGISFQHPSRFVLVGSMNPEEGDLRPQLLDRFAHAVDVVGLTNTVSTSKFCAAASTSSRIQMALPLPMPDEEDLATRIIAARARYDQVKYTEKEPCTDCRFDLQL